MGQMLRVWRANWAQWRQNRRKRRIESYRPSRPLQLPGAVPEFRRKARPGSFEVRVVRKWKTYDHYPIDERVWALFDSQHNMRFVLGVKDEGTHFRIQFIQREYSSPARRLGAALSRTHENFTTWQRIRDLETRENKALARQLGCHPSEFLVSEFLYQNREQIRQGKTVALNLGYGAPKLYKPIQQRFFGHENVEEHEAWLSKNKSRVKDALGI